MTRVEELIEGVLQFPADGRDVGEMLRMCADIRAQATIEDLPLLLRRLDSDRSDFLVREMLSEPVADLGGPTVLPELLRAYERNRADGHDNDSFVIHLIDLVELNPGESADLLSRILDSEERTFTQPRVGCSSTAQPTQPEPLSRSPHH